MNLRETLLEVHSKAQADKIASYVGDDAERFGELMKQMLGSVYRLSQRAAWPVSYCIERNPELIKPYWAKLVDQLEREDAHVAVRRNVARMLQFVDIPKRYQGRVRRLLQPFREPCGTGCRKSIFDDGCREDRSE